MSNEARPFMLFRNRIDAGRQLAKAVAHLRRENPIVLGIPRGGVPVAYEVARDFDAPLDVWVVRKIGAPFQPELGLGALAEQGTLYLDDELIRMVDAKPEEVAEVVKRERAELARRVKAFRGGRDAPQLAGRVVIVVDDGIATGGTLHAAVRDIRAQKPARIVIAVPVAATRSLQSFRREADEIVCLHPRVDLSSVGEWYDEFGQTRDDEVIELMSRSKRVDASMPVDRPPVELAVTIATGNVQLQGDLVIPSDARGLVLFAHGSGSSRRSSRNRAVAKALHSYGVGTLLFDLLTAREEAEDEFTRAFRFDIELLAQRLAGATDWASSFEATRSLPIGYFGASTGAAAALIAAARRRDVVRAVVSRGGRPDLAGAALPSVRAPVLLVVGGDDFEVLELNESAREKIRAPCELIVVPGATHLFEEPGALDEVARLAGRWFARYIGRPVDATGSEEDSSYPRG